jgi:uncharacterized membrane protein YccC
MSLASVIVSPYYRYRHASMLHAVRVGLAMLVSILVTSGIHVPNGIWASVTVLVVIGGLQHHGNIRKKAADRALGTLLGALVGLLLIAQLHSIGSMPLHYVLMSIAAGVCGYYAIGQAGYIALLAAITVCIVAGHGDSTVATGLWRTLNVLIGIAVALAFSFALPLYATYSWRYLLARMRAHTRPYRTWAAARRRDARCRLRTAQRPPSQAALADAVGGERGRHSAQAARSDSAPASFDAERARNDVDERGHASAGGGRAR